MAKPEVTYEIKDTIAVLSDSEGVTVECNFISFNGAEPKIDIRKWDRRQEEPKMWKGITLTLEEADTLCESLKDWIDITTTF